jgi:hypothetical protein
VTTAAPSTHSVLGVLGKERLVDLGRFIDVRLTTKQTRDDQIKTLLQSGVLDFERALSFMRREELKSACRAHGLDASGRARDQLVERLRVLRGERKKGPPTGELMHVATRKRDLPIRGDIVSARHRQWLVEDVKLPPQVGQQHLVSLVCLDDDNQGRELQLIWELELGATILQPEHEGLGYVRDVDAPRSFGAYLHALKWHSVSATDTRLFQSPFRAGIKLLDHQLTPLKKALDLPRANLFIADDVGLGKTIEAGLVLSELLLRQRVDYAVIACPAAIALQWRDEMQRRFGLHFEVYNRAFIARRRRERGFGVNPWTTHNRFIISYPLLRRPEYRDPLVAHLGDRLRKSLLILDEAHTAAPASNSRDNSGRPGYAIDSRVTRVVRDVAKRFENRLFLSATPHNGHSNSFSALLEILDPQRFTRGVPVSSSDELGQVMVRRLKADLREIGHGSDFPERKVIQLDLAHDGKRWRLQQEGQEPRALGETDEPFELTLASLLARYKETLLASARGKRGRFIFSNLQKRLLSSTEAFYRTLLKHAEAVRAAAPTTPAPATQLDLADGRADGDGDTDEYGRDDETEEALSDGKVAQASAQLAAPEATATDLLDQMLRVAGQQRGAPDAKALALIDWIRQHQCRAASAGGPRPEQLSADAPSANWGKAASWSDRRLIVFTEFAATKRYLHELLTTAIAGTEQASERILHFHGAMGDAQREAVQQAFNSPPNESPGAHPARHRRRPRGRQPPGPLRRPASTSTSLGTRRGWSSATGASTARCNRSRWSTACTSSTRSATKTRCWPRSCARSR